MAQVSELHPLPQPLSRMGDEELVVRARHGCGRASEYLLGKYRSLVEGKARAYFLAGADHEDVVQEGMIGLFKAIRDFSGDHLCAFRSFAELCVTRQIITAVKTATRQKHVALNSYVSMDLPMDDGEEDRTLADVLTQEAPDTPDDLVACRELQQELRIRIRTDLSALEAQTLVRYVEGVSYQDIAGELSLTVKQVDNALQRAKKKLGRHARAIHFA
jgi:RNA polymerase sporulation-specific sigma factor